MRLSWNEVRARASAFADEWQDARYEKEDTQSFYNEFFEIFDVRRRSVAMRSRAAARLGSCRDEGRTGDFGTDRARGVGIGVRLEVKE